MNKDTAGNALSLWVATKEIEVVAAGGTGQNYRDHDALRQTEELME